MGKAWMGLILAWLLWGAEGVAADAPPADGYCLRCHGMATLADHDPESGALVRLHVDANGFRLGSHGGLHCVACHEKGYEAWPHDKKEGTLNRDCVSCHGQDAKFDKYRLQRLSDQFEKSVHARPGAGHFTCGSCHDLHLFRTGASLGEKRVEEANQGCQTCHDGGKESAFTVAHQWLPNGARHMKTVRCVDCHTPRLEEVVHAVMPADKALKECVFCHTRDSLLLAQLYRHRVQSDREKEGLLPSLIANEAYVVGMTSHPWLDRFFFLLWGGTLAGVLGHGLLRWIAALKRDSGKSG